MIKNPNLVFVGTGIILVTGTNGNIFYGISLDSPVHSIRSFQKHRISEAAPTVAEAKMMFEKQQYDVVTNADHQSAETTRKRHKMIRTVLYGETVSLDAEKQFKEKTRNTQPIGRQVRHSYQA